MLQLVMSEGTEREYSVWSSFFKAFISLLFCFYLRSHTSFLGVLDSAFYNAVRIAIWRPVLRVSVTLLTRGFHRLPLVRRCAIDDGRHNKSFRRCFILKCTSRNASTALLSVKRVRGTLWTATAGSGERERKSLRKVRCSARGVLATSALDWNTYAS